MIASYPLISVIIPIYKVEKYLAQCLQSVVDQTFQDIEIIAVDDGSPDSCGQIVDDFAARDPRFKAIHKENGGYGSAVNVGLAIARGRYVAIVESDDYIEVTMLENLWAIAAETNADIVRGSYETFRNDVVTESVEAFMPERGLFSAHSHPEFLVIPPAIWSAIYRRQFLLNNALKVIETPGAAYQDVDFFVRTSLLAKSICCTSVVVYHYRMDNAGSSSNSKGNIDAIFKNYAKTDEFVKTLGTLPAPVEEQYNKRKICDIQWNFRRISPVYRKTFARHASHALGKIDLAATWRSLTVEQRRFFVALRWFPAISVLSADLIGRIRRVPHLRSIG